MELSAVLFNNDDYTVIKNSIKIPTVKPLYSNDINNILKDLFEQAYNKIDKNTRIKMSYKLLKGVSNKSEQLFNFFNVNDIKMQLKKIQGF